MRRQAIVDPGALAAGALSAALLLPACTGEDAPVMGGQRTVLSLLALSSRHHVVQESPSRPVQVGSIAPVWGGNGLQGALPALLMTPTSVVEIDVPPTWPDATLRFAAGLGRSAYVARSSPVRVRFTVELEGQSVFEHELDASASVREPKRKWVLGSAPIGAGGKLVLRTSSNAVDVDLEAGFGLLELTTPVRSRRTRSGPGRPSIVLILVDTLRADRLGCYGYERGSTPNIDALAERGLVFSTAYATSPWTWPSTASLLTGLTPPEHGVLNNDHCYLSERLTTVAEAARDAGLTTAAFSANPLISASQNYDQGFEHFWEDKWATADAVVEAIEPVLDEIAPYRFFLYIHLTDPHMPYEAPAASNAGSVGPAPDGFDYKPFRRLAVQLSKFEGEEPEHTRAWTRHASDLYDGEIAWVDECLGRLMELFRERGLADDLVVALTSDHGEEFLEHGQLGHSHQLFSETLCVPVILSGPGVPAGVRATTPVENRSLPSTLLELAGVEVPSELAGPSLLESVESDAVSDPIFFSTNFGRWKGAGRRSLRGVRFENYHFVWGPAESDGRSEVWALYDLERDPGAGRDIGATEHARVEALKGILDAWWTSAEQRRPDAFEGGSEAEQLLREIGYLGD